MSSRRPSRRSPLRSRATVAPGSDFLGGGLSVTWPRTAVFHSRRPGHAHARSRCRSPRPRPSHRLGSRTPQPFAPGHGSTPAGARAATGNDAGERGGTTPMRHGRAGRTPHVRACLATGTRFARASSPAAAALARHRNPAGFGQGMPSRVESGTASTDGPHQAHVKGTRRAGVKRAGTPRACSGSLGVAQGGGLPAATRHPPRTRPGEGRAGDVGSARRERHADDGGAGDNPVTW